jgi:hypothetical protein
MAYAYVGSAQNAGNAATITYSPTGGNYLIVVSETSAGGGSGIPTVTGISDNGTGGSGWTIEKATSQDGATNNDWFTVAVSPVASTGATTIALVFANGPPGTTNLAVIEFSGLSATGWQGISAFNEQVAPGAGTNAIASNNVNVTTQPALLLGWMCDELGNGGWTAGTSPNAFTRRVNGNYNMLEDFRITATGNALATATNTHGAADDFINYVMAISEPTIVAAPGSPYTLESTEYF